jgi:hypothetical protein
MSSTTTSSVPQDNAFAILSAIGQAAIDSRDPYEDLARLTERFEEQWFAAGGGTLRSPSLGGTSTTWYLGAALDEIQERRKQLGMDEYSPPSYTPSLLRPVPKQPAAMLTPSQLLSRASADAHLPPPPRLVRVNAFTSATTPPSPAPSEDMAMDALRSLRAELQIQQDDLYKDCFTAAEIAAQDAEHDELSRKIRALEDCLLAFGAIFRTR